MDTTRLANTLTRNTCPLCNSSRIGRVGDIRYPSPLLFSTTPVTFAAVPELWRCGACRSSFTQNVLPERDAVDLYRKGGSGQRWQTTRFEDYHRREVVVAMEECLTPGARVVDVGCNTGELLDFARGKGCETAGIEYSESSQQVVRAKGHALYADLASVSDGSVDVITAFDVMEHLYEPATFLAACHDKLRMGGRLVLLTGNPQCLGARVAGENWWYVRFPEHIVFPSRKYFALCRSWTLEWFVPTYAARHFKRPSWEVLRDTIYLMRTGNFTASPAIGPDHMLVVLQKRGAAQAGGERA